MSEGALITLSNGVELKAPGPGRLGAVAGVAVGRAELTLSGAAETPDKDALASVLTHVHALVVQHHCTRAVVDLTRLTFMNSSCFKELVTWISKVQEAAPADRYRIQFRYSPDVRWLKGSMHALSTFGVDVVDLETTGGAR